MSLFFNQSRQQNLDILRYLLFHEYSVDTQVLADRLDVSIKSIQRYCQRLNDDFQMATDSNAFLIEHKVGITSLTFPDNVVPSYLFDRLSAFYAEESVRVTIIDTLLSQKFPNVLALADDLYLTTAGLYNHLYHLETLLKPFDFSFNWSSSMDGLNFFYEEKKMRYFSYLFYWNMYKGFLPLTIESPLDNLAELDKAIDSQISDETFTVKKRQLKYLAQLTLWHMQQNNTVQLSPINKEILRSISSINDYSHVLVHPSLTPSEDEQLFFNFLARVTISALDSYEDKLTFIKSFIQNKSPLALYCLEMHDKLVRQFKCQPSEEDTINFYYDLLIFTMFNQELDVPFENEFLLDFDTNFYQKENLLQPDALDTMSTIFEEITEKYEFPLKNKVMSQSIMWLFLTSPHTQKMVTIAICIARSPMGVNIVKNRLLQLFNTDLLKFTEKTSEADLIISDYTPSLDSEQDFFYMDQLIDSHCWDLLFEVIQKKLSENVL